MFSFYKYRWSYIAGSIAVILLGLVLYFVNGFNVDIDFAGGSSIIIDINQTVDKEEIKAVATESLGFEPSAVQPTLEKPTEYTIKTSTLTPDQSKKLIQDFKTKFNLGEDYNKFSIDTFTPAYGKQLTSEAIWSMIIALFLIMIYVSVRFEFLSGIGAALSLLHDILVMVAIYIIFRIPINSSFVAAILTVLGYSINDTVVIFDRIRENLKSARKESFNEITDRSIWETMTRSINTVLTTLITISILYILGVKSIKEFAFPLIIGIASGAYSSIFIASPVWAMLRNAGIESRKKQFKKA
jgi:preprotein translocase subunit SecF